ncbi:hypothetical protein Zmor_010206 [Zophobas morio]|uniref:Uncharacterized protein n=1 Tax=Zophobas morio TaxID=2755281 RepID=A0AA38INC8_9CUCU|nr:hypothetical protein Zmor_010206 [Zophobas morio]
MKSYFVIVVVVILVASLCEANPVRNIIDTPDGCPEGYEKAHDGTCIEPFKLILPVLRAIQYLQVHH